MRLPAASNTTAPAGVESSEPPWKLLEHFLVPLRRGGWNEGENQHAQLREMGCETRVALASHCERRSLWIHACLGPESCLFTGRAARLAVPSHGRVS